MQRTLFVLPSLGRESLHVPDAFEGRVGLSGSRSAFLVVLDGLARLGAPVSGVVLSGEQLTGVGAPIYESLEEALAWVDGGRVIYCSWGDWEGPTRLIAAGHRPWIWLHTYLDKTHLDALDGGQIEAVLVPSDTARVHALRRRTASRVGRVYNPLHPSFEAATSRDPDGWSGQRVVFAGAIAEHKGAHRVLEIWPEVRASAPRASLVMAGSPRLYNAETPLGSLRVGAADFESRYVEPILARFGSLDAAGVEFPGLVNPVELRGLYTSATLGIANLNWSNNVETFGCAIAEMIATGLPVVGVARGALPETAGRTGAAELLATADTKAIAGRVASLLTDPDSLRVRSELGQDWVRNTYSTREVVRQWRRVLDTKPERVGRLTGPWRNTNRRRRWIESACGRMGCGGLLDRIEKRIANA